MCLLFRICYSVNMFIDCLDDFFSLNFESIIFSWIWILLCVLSQLSWLILCAEPLNFTTFHLPTLAIIYWTTRTLSESSCLIPTFWNVLFIVLSISFEVSSITFRSSIYCGSQRSGSCFILAHEVSVFIIPFAEEVVFFWVYVSNIIVKYLWLHLCGIILGSFTIVHWSTLLFFPAHLFLLQWL